MNDIKKISKNAKNILEYLVFKLQSGEIVVGDPSTYIAYSKLHSDLNLNMIGNTSGKSLEIQGLGELAEWIFDKGYPAITGLIINKGSYYPSKGYFEVYKKTDMDFAWWGNEIKKSSKFNWQLALNETELNIINKKQPVYPEEITEKEIKLPEGATKKVTINHYERNPKAREICIQYYGTTCVVCNMDFEKVYGDLGRGYIHVHHIVPVSKIKKQYSIDPIKDLRPVCPNCHAMLHARNPVLDIHELIEIMRKAKEK